MSALPDISVVANPHFVRIGGEPAVSRLVDAFYAAMDIREDARTIRALHEPDLSRTKAVLVTYLSEWLGGPKCYSAERGSPRLRRAHLPFAIDSAAAEAWLACMRQALDQTCGDAALRNELMAAFGKLAHHLINQASTHRSPA